jgi:hypothetical protein
LLFEGKKEKMRTAHKKEKMLLRNKLLLGLQVEMQVKLTISPLMGSEKHS